VTKLKTVLDCKDPKALAPFWAAALGYKELGAAAQYVLLGTGDRSQHELILQGVAEPKTAKNRMHLDIHAEDIEAEAERLVGLGATRLEGPVEELGESWIVLADPEGNELCVCSMVS
jgi:predicted enzyme related to lactoylglutathione lyase